MLEPPNLPTLKEKIRRNIQFRSKNIIKKGLKIVATDQLSILK